MEKPSQTSPPPPPPPAPTPTRVLISDEEKEKFSKEELLNKWKELNSYVDYIEEKDGDSKTVDEKLKLQQQESTRRENVLVMRLATKEQEMQEMLTQIQELKQAQTPSTTQLQSMLIDPAVNLLFEKMKTELTETKDRLDQAQNDLSAWKFTPDSVTGKKLMGKCRMLIQENQELGKQLSQGRIAQLEAELALQKKYSEELKGSQDEMNEFVIQLDEEVEGMQATICALQQQLKDSKRTSAKIEEENQRLCTRIDELDSSFTRTNKSRSAKNNDETSHHQRLSIRQSTELIHKNSDRKTNRSENHELEASVDVKDEPMDLDEKRVVQNIVVSRTLEQDSNLDNLPLMNQVKVIRGTEESKKDLDSQIHPYVSPPKGITKTSFSIHDLLSSKDSQRKDSDVSMDIALGLKHEENGENGTLNGEIDDAAI